MQFRFKRRRTDRKIIAKSGEPEPSSSGDLLDFKSEEVDVAPLRWAMKTKNENKAKKRIGKAKLKSRISKQIQLIPQQFMTIAQAKVDQVSVENIERPPDKYMINASYNIAQVMDESGVYRNQVRERRVAMDRELLVRELFNLFKRQRQLTLDEVCEALE